jgi:cytochrome c-type biogenesis protein CcmH
VLGDSEAASAAARDALKGVEDPAGRQRILSLLIELNVTAAAPAAAPAATPPATPPPALPGPTPDDVAAAQSMSPDDQNTMIQGMVAGLAERLQNEPDDVDGWLMLIRSYTVLEDAEAASVAARDALDGVEDPAGRQRIQSLLTELNVTPAETQ